MNAKVVGDQTLEAAQFLPVVQVRAHEYVAEQIRRHIQLRLSGPGDALPSERELTRQFGVGRPTIQMALRVLEAEHLIEARRGRGGGTFIVGPVEDEEARYDLIAAVSRRRDELAELLDFRKAVEPEIAAVAAIGRQPADLKRLQDALAALDAASDETEYMRYDTELHLALGAATHNRFLTDAGEKIRTGLNGLISLLPETSLWHERVGEEHHALVAAVAQREGETAAKLMRRHVDHTHDGALAVLAAVEHREVGR
ncbi:MAG: FadR/GntR family transcriptional regulator [Solirubrobacterales bacterium]